jgi:hypothetical protein
MEIVESCHYFGCWHQGFQFLYGSGEVAGTSVEPGQEANHLFFEVVKGLVAVEYPDRFLGEHFSGVFAGAAAGRIGGEPVDLVPFLLGEAEVEPAESVLIHGMNVLIIKLFNQNIYIC